MQGQAIQASQRAALRLRPHREDPAAWLLRQRAIAAARQRRYRAKASAIVGLLLLAITVAAAGAPVSAAPTDGAVTLLLNGEQAALPGLAIQNGVLMAPVETLYKLLGIQYSATTNHRAVRAFPKDNVIDLVAGQDKLSVYSGDNIVLKALPYVDADDGLMAPFYAVTTALQLKTAWDDSTRTVSLSDPTAPKPKPVPNERIPFTAADLDLLAHLIYSEAPNPDEPYEGQLGVGAVVVNRVVSRSFPDTIHDVIFARGQFDGIHNRLFKQTPSASALKAAKAVLYGADPTHGALYFYDPRYARDHWIFTLPVLVTLGHQRFCTAKTLFHPAADGQPAYGDIFPDQNADTATTATATAPGSSQ